MLTKLLVSLIPVFLLLLLLLFLDSLKLVNKKLLLASITWGFVSAGSAFLINTFALKYSGIEFRAYSAFIAPLVEETLKFSLLLSLIKKNRIGFMIDGAVYGFSIGAAFSLIENLFYLFWQSPGGDSPLLWVTRGFGTAVMHGGATAIFAILSMGAVTREAKYSFSIVSGATGAILIHGLFNQLFISPLLSTVVVMLIIPLSIVLIFDYNEKAIRHWLDLEFDSEVKMLNMIRMGQFSDTRTGSYLLSIRSHFPPEAVVDMYCYIVLYIELSIKAKSILLMKEYDFHTPHDSSLSEKLSELKSLRKSIGRGGRRAIAPVLRMSQKDLWKLTLLK